MSENKCQKCRFYIADDELAGRCFRYPPAASVHDKLRPFPRVMARRRNGEFKSKEKKKEVA